MAEKEEWPLLVKYIENRINLEIRLIELFILTITAQIVIVSLSEYKSIVFSVLINILAICWVVGLLVSDLSKKRSKESLKEFRNIVRTTWIPFGRYRDLFPLGLYILSIIIMGAIILIPQI